MKNHIAFTLTFVLLFNNCTCFFLGGGLKALLKEVKMNVTDVIQHYGYPCEMYEVTTEDGYVLSLQRIPFGVKNRETPRQVVLLQHGVLDTSFTWVNNGPEKSLAFILADQGFDVWLSNSRGSLYSRRHLRRPTSLLKYWDFTWDEMATYDLPAVINFALNVSKASKLGYVGHSQGSQIGFAQFSKNTSLNSKVSAFVALAPVVYIGHAKTAIRLFARLAKGIRLIYKWLGTGEFLPNTQTKTIIQLFLCGIRFGSSVCKNIAFLLQGFNSDNMNSSRMAIYLSHYPAGTSTKNIVHYAQSYLSKKFQYYDYGRVGNLRHYKQTSPPLYNLNTNGLPIAMFWGGNDWFAVPKDVEKAIAELGDNVKFKKFIPEYNHLDFIWGIDTAKHIYPDLVNFLKKYN